MTPLLPPPKSSSRLLANTASAARPPASRIEKRGGRRRRHCPPALSPQQVRDAALQLQAGRLIKHLAIDLKVDRKTLHRALSGQGSYAGILPHPVAGRPGSRPILSADKVARAATLRNSNATFEQIADQQYVCRETARSALKQLGAYACTRREI